jgi:ribonuclease D
MPQLVDTRDGLSEMLSACKDMKQLAVDMEGIALNRHGKACLLAVATSPTSVWVVDTITLGKAAFQPVGDGLSLKTLLESPQVGF